MLNAKMSNSVHYRHQYCQHPRVNAWDLACDAKKQVDRIRNPMSLNQKAQDFAKLNLNYVVPTEGDGNCFFRAVSEVASTPLYQADIQEPMKTFCRDHLLLREAVTVWLANMYEPEDVDNIYTIYIDNYLRYEKMCRTERMNDGTEQEVHNSMCGKRQGVCPSIEDVWDEALNKMFESREWCEFVFVMATAWFLEHDICYVSRDSTEEHPLQRLDGNMSWSDNGVSPAEAKREIYLSYLTDQRGEGIHFQSLLPMEQIAGETKCWVCGREFEKSLMMHLARTPACSGKLNSDAIAQARA